MKRPTMIMITLLGAVLVAVLVIVANVRRADSQVKGIEVKLRYGDQPRLVQAQVVEDSVMAAIPTLNQQRVKDVDCEAVAAAAARVPYIKEVVASVSVSGRVVVNAEQRRPIGRLFYGRGEYYLDADGGVFPVSEEGDCDVMVLGGEFVEPLRADSLNSQVEGLWKVARFLDEHPKYGVLVDQAYIERDGDIMLAPKVGDHVIELGTAEELEKKFAHLLEFYRKGMPLTGWDAYSKLSLKFEGQVVCTRNNK